MKIRGGIILGHLFDEFTQWQKDTGRIKYEPTDIYVNENGKIKVEKKMAWVMDTSPKDWREFCKETGRDYEGVRLLAIYDEVQL